MYADITERQPPNRGYQSLPLAPAWEFDEAGRAGAAESASWSLAQLRQAFEAFGGLATGDHVAGLMRPFSPQPISQLARRVVARQLVIVAQPSGVWLPMFQFDRATMLPLRAVSEVLAELRERQGDWEIAQWFAQCNAQLGGAAPMERVVQDPGAVVRAARAFGAFSPMAQRLGGRA